MKNCKPGIALLVIAIAVGLATFLLIQDSSIDVVNLAEDSETIFSVSNEVAPVVESWSTHTSRAFGYVLTYPSSWGLNNRPGVKIEDVGDPAEVSIGDISINVVKSDHESALDNCDEISCDYFQYGYGDLIDSGATIMLDEPAIWEMRTSGGHTYYNVVFKKFGNIYSFGFLNASSANLDFDQMWSTYSAILALFRTHL
ncbi:hypothetical protein HOI18_02030 [Candidatus Uhrbacteria bacterium]|jgi:hypothetical protein|nr:hypothetical protein [Candidatus Uhrbacteria bacterium]